MNENQKTVEKLRNEGYAVVVFNPDELRGANPDSVEGRLVEMGWDVINWFATEPDDEG